MSAVQMDSWLIGEQFMSSGTWWLIRAISDHEVTAVPAYLGDSEPGNCDEVSFFDKKYAIAQVMTTEH